jgi:amidase
LLLTCIDELVRTGNQNQGLPTKSLSLTEVLFDDALKRAHELDVIFNEHGRIVGPLHGVPMTLKDQFDVAGYDSTLGYVGRAFKEASEDCVLVALLKEMGAIIIAKSNLPQSIMVRDTQSTNAVSRSRTAVV